MEEQTNNQKINDETTVSNQSDFSSSLGEHTDDLEASSIFDIQDDDSEMSDNEEIDNYEDPDDLDQREHRTDEVVEIQKSKLVIMKKMAENLRENAEKLEKMLAVYINSDDESMIKIAQFDVESGEDGDDNVKVIEGVFDGEQMIGPDGKQYSVPPNYASKSKLVEGDLLKLTIAGNGGFIYKQTSPIERIRKVGKLFKDAEGRLFVVTEKGKWRVLPASITYFKGDIGDEVVVLIPKNGHSLWGAVENIVKKRI